MPKLAGFGDEIDKSIDTQIEVMRDCGVHALELRAAEGQGVLDLEGDVRETVRAKLRDGGIEVFSIGSPIGKVAVDSPFEDEQKRLAKAIEQAHFFGTKRIRVFSFFVPNRDFVPWRSEVLRRMGLLVSQAAAEDCVLCHENEARIYGETLVNCVEMLSHVDSPAFRAVHDTANWLHAGEEPFPAAYEAVKPWLEYVHIKDRDVAANETRPAGEGDGRMPDLFRQLREDGWDGYLSLEPHIGGGPDNFRRAATALKRCLDSIGWSYE